MKSILKFFWEQLDQTPDILAHRLTEKMIREDYVTISDFLVALAHHEPKLSEEALRLNDMLNNDRGWLLMENLSGSFEVFQTTVMKEIQSGKYVKVLLVENGKEALPTLFL